MAFFQPEVWPTAPIRRRLRRFLPRMVTVLTSLTRMPWASYWSSRAFLISVLVAVRATLNVYRPWVYSRYVRSVMTGPMTTSEAARVVIVPPGLHGLRDRRGRHARHAPPWRARPVPFCR